MEELAGKSVMIHPNLTQDPVHMQGHLGTISHVVYDDDSVYVKFKNQMLGLYSADAVLMLIPGEIVLDKLRHDVYEMDMDASEVVDILGIYLLDATGKLQHQQEALDWAMGNAKVMTAITFTVRDWIDFQLERLDREQEPGRGL